MKLAVFAIFDQAIEAYMKPFFAQSEGQAVRMFEDEVRNEASPLFAHPEHYMLFRIGNYYDGEGRLEPLLPECLRKAHEVGKKAELQEVVPALPSFVGKQEEG